MLPLILIFFFVVSSSGFRIFPHYEEARWELIEGQQPEVSKLKT